MERESEMSQIEAARIIRDQGGNCDEPICINCGGDDDCPLLDICGSRGWNQERTLNDIINWLAENDKRTIKDIASPEAIKSSEEFLALLESGEIKNRHTTIYK